MKYFLLADLKSLLPIILPIAGVVLVVVVLLVIFLVRRNRKPKIADADWFEALGGKENIKEAIAVGSRLSLYLNDKEAINRDRLKELGVSSVLVMSNKVTLVIEGQAEKVAAIINNSL